METDAFAAGFIGWVAFYAAMRLAVLAQAGGVRDRSVLWSVGLLGFLLVVLILQSAAAW